jgi:Gas vesicle synthesis protein GvpL/GvpF
MTVQAPTQPVYVYGVVREDVAPVADVAGVAGADVGAVRFEGLAALTSPVASTHVRARRKDLLAHSDVLGGMLERGPVIPLQFGIVLEDEDAVVSQLLRPRKRELERLLRELDGRVELSVKAFYLEEAILAEIVHENRRVARLREATRTGPGAATYGARIELGELIAGELRARGQRDGRAILDRLAPLAKAVQVAGEPVEHEVLRASFLVERKRVGAFDEAVNDIARSQDGRMRFKYLGPLPPHNFTSFRWDS